MLLNSAKIAATLIKQRVGRLCRRWAKDDRGNIVIETAMLFPLLMTMLMGSFDAGQGLLVNKKLISAAHIASDLIAREKTLSDDMLNEFIEAAHLSMEPYAIDSFGIDVVGIRFVGEDATPTIQWRDTFDMDPVANIETLSEGLGKENEGIVAVTVVYTYQPRFSNVIVDPINMQETAFVRGRVSSFVQRE